MFTPVCTGGERTQFHAHEVSKLGIPPSVTVTKVHLITHQKCRAFLHTETEWVGNHPVKRFLCHMTLLVDSVIWLDGTWTCNDRVLNYLSLLLMVITQVYRMLIIQNLFLLGWLFNMIFTYSCYHYLLSSAQFTCMKSKAVKWMEFQIMAIPPPRWTTNLSSGKEGVGLIDLRVLPPLTFYGSLGMGTSCYLF